jgi:acetyl/propionyl-CoA carboxylase alpha subunit
VRSTAWVRELIERSLGAPESFPVVCARTAFAELAQDLGIRVPHTEIIANHSDLERWVARMGLPTVLKANGTSGGYGVRIVQTMDEAERAFRKLQAPPSLRQAFLSRDRTLIWPCLKREQPVMNAQRFVVGREVTSTIACWKGTVIGALHFEVVNKLYSTGPASVLRLIENPEMLTAAERVVCQLKLSGIHGFDFILEAQTGNLFLIEINARATQVGHLALGPGRDLPAALCAAVSGVAVQAAPRVTENDTIALFPQEWMRDPGSKFLQSSYHDVPWTEPGLLKIR